MLKPKYLLPFLIIAILFVGFIVGSPFIVNKIFAQASLSGPLTGYAWSSNIGWIKFHSDGSDPVPFGVQLGSDGKLTGQAWSSNIGWISFDNLGTGPDNQGSASLFGASSIKGWARACSVFTSGCTGALKNDIYRGGWDGWLQMGPQTTTNGWPGVSIENNHQLTGYAWGSEILGWVKFDGLFSGTCTGVCIGTGLSLQCTASNSTPNVNETIQFVASPSNGKPSYSYVLSINNINDPNHPVEIWKSEAGEYILMSGPASTGWKPLAPGKYMFSAEVKDGQSNTAQCSAQVVVASASQPQLKVTTTGAGKVIGNGISCGNKPADNDCQENYDLGTVVTLTANPQKGATFQGWDSCDAPAVNPDTGVNTCKMTMDKDKVVTAHFSPIKKFSLSASYPGNGRSMLVNYQTQNLDAPHDSTHAKIVLTDLDPDDVNPTNITFTLVRTSLNNRCTDSSQQPTLKMTSTPVVGGNTEIYLSFPGDCQPTPSVASPYAGNYALRLMADPHDGSQVDPININFVYTDLREREQ